MRHYREVVHRQSETVDGQGFAALWPEHKPLAEVLKLRATTPPLIWEAMYNGNPTPAGGYTFRREWWGDTNHPDRNRYHFDDRTYSTRVIARFQSYDTAEEAGDDNARTAGITADLLNDYRLLIRSVFADRLTFDVLPETIVSQARLWNGDGRLKQVIIEDKSSGKSAKYTLRASAPPWLRDMLFAFQPLGSKEARAASASVWCANGMVLLPHPGPAVPWLLDFEDELFSFPRGVFADQVDALSQLILYCENYLAAGWRARGGGQ